MRRRWRGCGGRGKSCGLKIRSSTPLKRLALKSMSRMSGFRFQPCEKNVTLHIMDSSKPLPVGRQAHEGRGVKKTVSAGIIVFRRTTEGIKYLLLYHGRDYWNF